MEKAVVGVYAGVVVAVADVGIIDMMEASVREYAEKQRRRRLRVYAERKQEEEAEA
jgi:hypothetical protein